MRHILGRAAFGVLRGLASSGSRLERFVKRADLHEQQVTACEPGKEQVLVIAPHMDDEVLGCGGTLARHAQAGATVVAVFLTSGTYGASLSAGTAGVSAESLRLTETRKDEARQAARILGIAQTVFLDAHAGTMRTDTAVLDDLCRVVERIAPAVVYVPSFLERHPDHRAAAEMLATVMDASNLRFDCRSYEVWTPLFPNLMVNIDATLELKRRALSCYTSQLEHTDLLHMGIALNAYRSAAVPGAHCRHAEAFHSLPATEYRRLLARFTSTR